MSCITAPVFMTRLYPFVCPVSVLKMIPETLRAIICTANQPQRTYQMPNESQGNTPSTTQSKSNPNRERNQLLQVFAFSARSTHAWKRSVTRPFVQTSRTMCWVWPPKKTTEKPSSFTLTKKRSKPLWSKWAWTSRFKSRPRYGPRLVRARDDAPCFSSLALLMRVWS